MNTLAVILLLIGGIVVFFIPMIVGKMTGTHMEHVKGRVWAIVKDEKFQDTEEARELQSIVFSLDAMGYGPYSRFGMMEIRSHMSKLPKHIQTLSYTDDNIKLMLKWIGVEENEHTRRVKKQQPGIGYSISGSM